MVKLSPFTPANEKAIVQNVISGLIVASIASLAYYLYHHYFKRDGKA